MLHNRRASIHSITHELEVSYGDEYYCPTIEFRFSFSPGYPAYTPPGEYAPTDPPEGPEISLDRVEVVIPAGWPGSPSGLIRLAEEWFNSPAGQSRCIEYAEENY